MVMQTEQITEKYLDDYYDKSGVAWAKTGKSHLKKKFAFMPTHCRKCRKYIHLCWFYGMPMSIKFAYEYGPYINDHHCVECHDQEMEKRGFCNSCHVGWGRLAH